MLKFFEVELYDLTIAAIIEVCRLSISCIQIILQQKLPGYIDQLGSVYLRHLGDMPAHFALHFTLIVALHNLKPKSSTNRLLQGV